MTAEWFLVESGMGGELERYWDKQCDEIVAMSVNVWRSRMNAMIE